MRKDTREREREKSLAEKNAIQRKTPEDRQTKQGERRQTDRRGELYIVDFWYMVSMHLSDEDIFLFFHNIMGKVQVKGH